MVIRTKRKEKRTTIQLYESVKKELTKVCGELQAQNGKQRSYEDAISEVINFWKRWHQTMDDHLGLIDMIKQKRQMRDLPSCLAFIIEDYSGIFKEQE